MNAGPWWKSLEQEPRLSQGDVVTGISFATLLHPAVPVVKNAVQGHGTIWKPCSWTPDKQGYCHCVARGRLASALVLTHSCTLDKPLSRQRVVIAPISVLVDQVSDQTVRDNIMSGGNIAFVPLPSVPVLGDCYADLRLMTAINRDVLEMKNRIATMTEVGVRVIQERVSGFFVRPGDQEKRDKPAVVSG
jgi:hypothetical protein